MKKIKKFFLLAANEPILSTFMAVFMYLLLIACVVALLVTFLKKHTEFVTIYRVACGILVIIFLITDSAKDSGKDRERTQAKRILLSCIIGCLTFTTAFVFLTFTYIPIAEVITGDAWPVPRNSSVLDIVVGLLGISAFLTSFIILKKK